MYDLHNSSNILVRNSTLKIFLFGATNIGQNNDKSKYVYSVYGITFDEKDGWKFGNDSARNILILVLIIVHYLILIMQEQLFELDEGNTCGINGSFDAIEKKV